MSPRRLLPLSRLASIPVALVIAVAALASACAGTPTPGGYVQETEVLHQPFITGHVAPAIGWSCGSLDCHGTTARNMRIFSQYGLRLALGDTPGGMPITQPEVDADFRSVSALEPEIMNTVVAEGGAHPERLTLIRKARGTEHHKGGTIMVPGDHLDTCLTTWLAGTPNQAECDAASQPP
jgi:hypothetical protein